MSVVRRLLAALTPPRAQLPQALLCALALAACSFDDSTNKWLCKVDDDCASHGTSYECRSQICMKKAVASQPGKSDAAAGDGAASIGNPSGDAAIDAAAKDASTSACTKDEYCFDGKMEQSTVGACKAGMRKCESATGVLGDCLGQVLPTAETCNGVDDDCDGMTDEDIATGSCASSAQGACNVGTLSCDRGVMRCQAAVEPAVEVCDGVDNDCDGKTDEDTDVVCYPPATVGCTAPATPSDAWSCTGVCATGKQLCQQGTLQPCSDFKMPEATDDCTPSGAPTASDDDCDGKIDEDCACTNGLMQNCYTGPQGTEGHGKCVHGTQTCTANKFGDCTGAIMPTPETCANEGVDDDCDGMQDNIPARGNPCVAAGNQGVCSSGTLQCQAGMTALVCTTPAPAADEACDGVDDDCDGIIDEGFDLKSDPLHCGACATQCDGALACCSGTCTDTQSDANHCGLCATACGSGRDCCSGVCQSLQTDKNNCGSCANKCGQSDTCCGGQCVSTQTDHENCNGCGHRCGSDETCCAGACVSLQTDSTNCGTCGKNCTVLVGTCSCKSGACKGALGMLCL